jgi:hypothetical protein
VVIWWRPNYYLIFDEENVYHPSSFRRCVRYLFRASHFDTAADVIGTNRPVIDDPSFQDDIEVEKYLEKVPLLENETDQVLTEPYEDDDSPTPTQPAIHSDINNFIYVDDDSPTCKRPQSPPPDLEQLVYAEAVGASN